MDVTVIDGTPILMFSDRAIAVKKNTKKKKIKRDTKFRSRDDLFMIALTLARSRKAGEGKIFRPLSTQASQNDLRSEAHIRCLGLCVSSLGFKLETRTRNSKPRKRI